MCSSASFRILGCGALAVATLGSSVGCSRTPATAQVVVGQELAAPAAQAPVETASTDAQAARDSFARGDYEQAVEQFTLALGPPRGQPTPIRPELNEAAIYLERGIAFLRMGFPDTALQDFTTVIALSPHNSAAYEQRAIASMQMGDLYSAVRDATEAIRNNPRNAAAYRTRGGVYLRRAQYDRSIADLEKALAEDPTLTAVITPQLGEAFYRWSQALEHDGDQVAAEEKLLRAEELNPEFVQSQAPAAPPEVEVEVIEQTVAKPVVSEAEIRYQRGRDFQLRDDNDHALIEFTASITLDPLQSQAYLRRGETLLAMNFPDTALEDLQTAAANGQATAEIHLLEARAHLELGSPNRAAMSATDALHDNPTDARSYALRGQAYLKMENWERAIADLDEAIRRDPDMKQSLAPSLAAARQGQQAALEHKLQASSEQSVSEIQ